MTDREIDIYQSTISGTKSSLIPVRREIRVVRASPVARPSRRRIGMDSRGRIVRNSSSLNIYTGIHIAKTDEVGTESRREPDKRTRRRRKGQRENERKREREREGGAIASRYNA